MRLRLLVEIAGQKIRQRHVYFEIILGMIEHCAEIGRDPGEIEVSVKVKADGDPIRFADLVSDYRDAGARHVIAMFEAPFDPSKLGAVAERLRPLIA